MHTATVRLRPKPPFDFSASVRFLQAFAATQGEQFGCGGHLAKAFREDGVTVLVRLLSAGSVEQPELVCDMLAERPITRRAQTAIGDRVSFWLSLDDDLTDFYKRADDVFAPVVDQLHGYHQVKFPTPLEMLCWAILVQRTPMHVAQATKHRLIEQFGGDLRIEGVEALAFPDVEQLASLSRRRLEAVTPSSTKGQRLAAAIATFAELGEEFFRSGPYDEVKRALLEVPGIGAWSASFVLIRGLGRTEEVALDDELTDAVSRVYGEDVDAATLRDLAEPYGPWRGYWAHYLRLAA